MAITEVAYCTREDVQRGLNLADNPRLNGLVDRAVQAGARELERLLHRRFYLETKTVAFDQPHDGINLWLDELELSAAPTQMLSAGVPMVNNTDYFMRPRSGPPYGWIEAAFNAQTFWMSQSTPQAAISVTGDFGYPTDNIAVTALAASITAGSSTLFLSDSSQAGTGSLILIDSERMIVSDRGMSSTTATITADLASAKSTVSVAVSNGSLLNVGETILIDSERMFIQYITGNTLTVERATGGTTLATHTNGATIYAPRTATVLRGKLGTTAASHSSSATIYRMHAPSLIRDYNLALAETSVQQALGGYVRQLGQGQTQRDSAGVGLDQIATNAYAAYGRKGRMRSV